MCRYNTYCPNFARWLVFGPVLQGLQVVPGGGKDCHEGSGEGAGHLRRLWQQGSGVLCQVTYPAAVIKHACSVSAMTCPHTQKVSLLWDPRSFTLSDLVVSAGLVKLHLCFMKRYYASSNSSALYTSTAHLIEASEATPNTHRDTNMSILL